jgi:phosphoglycerate dehydrogenase-like enzyme
MMEGMKAFIFDPLWDELVTKELEGRLQEAGIDAVVVKEIAPLTDCSALYEGEEERLLCVNPDYVNWKLTPDDYKDIPNLKGIFGSATSFSWIDSSYADQNNIPVCNIRGFSSEAVAEWATMMMLNVARQTPRLIKDGFPLDFDTDYMKYRGIEIHGKTAGIIGLGNIGKAIAKRCAGLGMNVTYWSQNSRTDEYEYTELSSLMSGSDVIFPVLAVNDETKKLFTPELLDSIKSSAMVIDIVNELIEHEPLIEKVRAGKLYGLGFEAKPGTFADYEGNIWAAPAYGWVTDNSMYGTEEKWVENMVNAAQGKFPNRIN